MDACIRLDPFPGELAVRDLLDMFLAVLIFLSIVAAIYGALLLVEYWGLFSAGS